MTTKAFTFSSTPIIHFGNGKFDSLISHILRYGRSPLFVIGRSFKSTPLYAILQNELKKNALPFIEVLTQGEPTPKFIDGIVNEYSGKNISTVVAIGGGSTIDSGKAISAMLLEGYSVRDYLEGMELRLHSGRKVPFIAIPTTAGTGSEATKNAVISEVGPGGFKKSLRHENFVPDIAIVDPLLTLSCPANVTASSGLDALTQLMEAFVSTESSHITDALALSGLQHFTKGFQNAWEHGDKDTTARAHMSYAALISGMVLSSSGLGTVHGFASSIGGFYEIPHGVICGTMLGEVTDILVNHIIKDEEEYHVAIKKYGNLGRILTGNRELPDKESCINLVPYIKNLITLTQIPRLGDFRILEKDVDKIVTETSNKNSPYKLNIGQLKQAVRNRL